MPNTCWLLSNLRAIFLKETVFGSLHITKPILRRTIGGLSVQDLFLWFPVRGLHVDIPCSGVIYFNVRVVHDRYFMSLFETQRDCVADVRNTADSGFTGGIEKWTEHCRPMGMNHRKDGVEFGSMGKRVVEVGRK
ncbi:hypothetical protein Bca4012_078134 [Brassica carinata]